MLYWPGVSLNVFTKKFRSTMKAKCGINSAGTGKFNAAWSDAMDPMLAFRPFNHSDGDGVEISTAAVVAAAPGRNGFPSGEYS